MGFDLVLEGLAMLDYRHRWTVKARMEARMEARAALVRFTGKEQKGTGDLLLRRLCDFHDNQASFVGSGFRKSDYDICKLLAGPHGYTIFKMLCAKNGIYL